MNVKFDFPIPTADRTVYVRALDHAELPDDVHIEAGETIYGIHDEDGECLALAKNRAVAFSVARSNAYQPVSVH